MNNCSIVRKVKKGSVLILIFAMTTVLWAGESDDSPWMIEAGMGPARLLEEPVISLDGRVSYTLFDWFELGFEAAVFHTLEKQYLDEASRPFQAEASRGALFVRAGWQINERMNLGMKISSGMQRIQFRYSGSLRDEMTWEEELLDVIDAPSLSGSLSFRYSLCPVHAFNVEGGYRNLHPTETPVLSDGTLGAGLFANLSYGFRI